MLERNEKPELLENLDKIKKLKKNYNFIDFETLENLQLELNARNLMMIDEASYKIIDKLDISIYWKDAHGQYLGCNQYMLDVIGLKSREELIGKTDEDCVWKDQASVLQAADHKVLQEKKTIQTEEPVITANGAVRIFASVKKPIFNEQGEAVAVLGASTDITDYKKALEEKILAQQISRQENRYRQVLSVYSGGMSHDLKNPLNKANLSLEMLEIVFLRIQKRLQLPEDIFKEIEPYLNYIKESHQDLQELIDHSNQLIQQTTSDNPKPILKSIEISKLFNKSLTNFNEDIASGLITVDIVDQIKISADELSFMRIIINLLENAKRQIRLKKRGKIYIHASLQGPEYLISIKDTAGDLTQADIDRIFQRYKTNEVQGTGLGLQGSSLLMEAMGGTLSAQLVDKDCIAFMLRFPR